MVKVLCCKPPGGAFHHITRSWGAAFSALGHQFARWDGNRKSWERFKPDLYLGSSGHMQPIPQDLRKRFGTKIGIHVNPYGKVPLVPIHGANINEPTKSIVWLKRISPDFVFGYGLQDDEGTYWGHYKRKLGIPWYGVPNAGDMLHFYEDYDKSLECDIGFVGGRWPYKAHNLDQYLVPVLKKHSYRCYGWGGWEGICKYSKLPDKTDIDRKLFSTAKISPSICEPHTTKYSIDWPERIFKVPLTGGFTISDNISGFDRYLPTDIFPMAASPKQFKSLVNHYLTNEQERKEMASKQKKYILDNHTYFDRVKTFLRAGGFKDEARKVAGVKEKLINDLHLV